MRYVTTTLGCKVNQFETQAMERILSGRGHVPAAEGEKAEAVIINTCSVTAESGRKSRQAVRRLRAENPGALLAVCGCYSQNSPEAVRELEADLIFGSGDREELVLELERRFLENRSREYVLESVDDPWGRLAFEVLPPGPASGRTRAMMKIQDGCVNFCTYCIIPYLRGRVRSLPLAEAVNQAAALRDAGFREIVITGIEIASYGRDLDEETGLIDLIEAVSNAAPDVRIRLGSLEPGIITGDFVSRLAECKNICGHFHLSLQSGCDDTLKRMGRKYDTGRFYDAVCLLRGKYPRCGMTADLIAGFPGETDGDFEKTMEFITKCAFSSMHIFPYSIRPGTKAAEMSRQLSNGEKTARARRAGKRAEEMELGFLKSCVGESMAVLFETEKGGYDLGHGENYLQVAVPAAGLAGLVKNVEITGISGKMLVGVVR